MRNLIRYLLTFVFAFIAGMAIACTASTSLPNTEMQSDAECVAPKLPSVPRFTALHDQEELSVDRVGEWTHDYITDDSQGVTEGMRVFPSIDRARLELIKVRPDARLMELQYLDNEGFKGVRRVLAGATILTYDGSNRFRFINAPSEALAREFEQYLVSQGRWAPLTSKR
jgi:hypothetical protein